MVKQISLFDDDGTMIRTVTVNGSPNEGEWIIMYRDAIQDLVDTAPDFTTLRLFLKLTGMQEYGDKPIKTTKKALADELGVKRNHLYKCLNWLKANNYVQESKSRGQTQFDLNPDRTTCGRDRDKKLIRWNELKNKGITNIIDLSNVE